MYSIKRIFDYLALISTIAISRRRRNSQMPSAVLQRSASQQVIPAAAGTLNIVYL